MLTLSGAVVLVMVKCAYVDFEIHRNNRLDSLGRVHRSPYCLEAWHNKLYLIGSGDAHVGQKGRVGTPFAAEGSG